MSGSTELMGSVVRLAATTIEHEADLVAIRATPEVRQRWRGDDLVEEFREDLLDSSIEQFTIIDKAGRIVGLIQFGEETDPDYRHASIDIYVDPSQHRRGYASDAIRTLADYLFDQHGHHRIAIDPAADNEAAIACYAKVGFQPVGPMRSYERQADGEFADGLLMDMLASDRA